MKRTMTKQYELYSTKTGDQVPSQCIAPKQYKSLQVNFYGLNAIDAKTLKRECDILSPAGNTEQLLNGIARLQQGLLNTKCFTVVRPVLDSSKDGHYSLNLYCTEAKRDISFGTNLNQKGDVSADLCVTAPCLRRGLNSMSLNGRFAGLHTRQLTGNYIIPHIFNMNKTAWNGDLAVHITELDQTTSSSYVDISKGTELSLSDEKQRHRFSLGFYFHSLTSPLHLSQYAPSIGVSACPPQHQKACLKYFCYFPYTFFKNNLNYRVLGDIKTGLELAYLPRKDYFGKFETTANHSIYFNRFFTIHHSISAGYLSSLNSSKSNHIIPIQDRFFLGGYSGVSSTLNGFGSRQVGPALPCRTVLGLQHTAHTKRQTAHNGAVYDYIGGHIYTTTYMGIYKQLQFKELPSIRPSLFFYFNSGILANSLKLLHYNNLWNCLRLSTGVGVSIPITKNNSFEFVATHPIKAHLSDITNTFQVGIRVRHFSA